MPSAVGATPLPARRLSLRSFLLRSRLRRVVRGERWGVNRRQPFTSRFVSSFLPLPSLLSWSGRFLRSLPSLSEPMSVVKKRPTVGQGPYGGEMGRSLTVYALRTNHLASHPRSLSLVPRAAPLPFACPRPSGPLRGEWNRRWNDERTGQQAKEGAEPTERTHGETTHDPK